MRNLLGKLNGAPLRVILAACCLLAGLPLRASAVAATANNALTNLSNVGGMAGYGTTTITPAQIAGNIIGYALALLGVLFTILIIYAGFLYMTAQGNEEQVSKAKKLLINAIIGMIIIGAAYAISSFVIGQIIRSTTEAPTTPATP